MPISVLLVDDHAIVRDGLAALLGAQPDIEVIASVGDGRAAVRAVGLAPPDVAVVDVALPGMNGIETARRIHETSAETHVLMLSMYASPEYVFQAMRAGASGYVLKESAAQEVVAAVRAVHAGKRYFSARIDSGKLDEYLRNRGTDSPLERLSAREREVLQLIVEGHTSAGAAARLGLSPKSIDTYRSRLMAKLEIDQLPALVKFAIRHGITTVE